MNEILLRAENITKSFPGVRALDSVNFELRKGELHCLVGENGAGKTTFVKVIYGAYPDYDGEIFLNGDKIRITHPLQARELGIAAIQQHRDLVPHLSGEENIFLGMEETKGIFIDRRAQNERARTIVDRFDKSIGLQVPVKYLTVAEQEIVAIAKALVRRHRILILDEATAPLDRNERKVLFDVLNEMKREGDIGIIFISHHINELFEIGDRVTVFKDGKLVATKDIKEVNFDDVVQLMIGQKERKRFTKKKASLGEEILKITGLSVPGALSDIDVSVRGGEIVGVAGRLGSNKEKIAEAVFGLIPITKGKVFFNKKPLLVKRPEGAIRKGIGLLPIDRREEGLILCRSVAENVVLAWLNKLMKRFLSVRLINFMTRDYVGKLGIKTTSVNQRVEYLSGGNQQKVVMAKWLTADADLLILLEPTEGIDVQTRWDIYRILGELAESGKGILVISSDLEEIIALSDRVYVMSDGRIVEELKGDKIEYRHIFNKTISDGTSGSERRGA